MVIQLIPRFRPDPHAPLIHVTHNAVIRCGKPGTIEVVMVESYTTPWGTTEYRQVGTQVWPVDALLEASAEFKLAFRRLMQRELIH